MHSARVKKFLKCATNSGAVVITGKHVSTEALVMVKNCLASTYFKETNFGVNG